MLCGSYGTWRSVSSSVGMGHVSPAHPASSYSPFPCLVLLPMYVLSGAGKLCQSSLQMDWRRFFFFIIFCGQSHLCSNEKHRELLQSAIPRCCARGHEQSDLQCQYYSVCVCVCSLVPRPPRPAFVACSTKSGKRPGQIYHVMRAAADVTYCG